MSLATAIDVMSECGFTLMFVYSSAGLFKGYMDRPLYRDAS
jgi:hypothetical protein